MNIKFPIIADDQGKIAAPANWSKNELICEDVIIPPPADEKTAKTRLIGGEMICYDWWFCHKKI